MPHGGRARGHFATAPPQWNSGIVVGVPLLLSGSLALLQLRPGAYTCCELERPLVWKLYIPPKRLFLIETRIIMSQKITSFTVAAAKTSQEIAAFYPTQ
jgi:hypothetical protein